MLCPAFLRRDICTRTGSAPLSVYRCQIVAGTEPHRNECTNMVPISAPQRNLPSSLSSRFLTTVVRPRKSRTPGANTFAPLGQTERLQSSSQHPLAEEFGPEHAGHSRDQQICSHERLGCGMQVGGSPGGYFQGHSHRRGHLQASGATIRDRGSLLPREGVAFCWGYRGH